MPRLDIDLVANVARLQRDMQGGVRTVEKAVGDMRRAAAGARNLFAGLGVGLSVVGIARFAKGVIDAGDRLNDLSQITGVSASKLSEYDFGLKQTGGDLDQLKRAFVALGKNIAEGVNDPLSDSAQLMRNLGVEFKGREVAQVFEDLARAIGRASDQDPNKIATIVKAFGKGSEELIPFINQLDELGKQARESGAALSNDFARDADRFNDAIAAMSAGVKKFTSEALVGGFNFLSNALSPDTIEQQIQKTQAQLESLRNRGTDLLDILGIATKEDSIKAVEARLKRLTDLAAAARQRIDAINTGPPRPPESLPVPPGARAGSDTSGKDAEKEAQRLQRIFDQLKAEDQRIEQFKADLARAVEISDAISGDLRRAVAGAQLETITSEQEASAARLAIFRDEMSERIRLSDAGAQRQIELQAELNDAARKIESLQTDSATLRFDSMLDAWQDTGSRLKDVSADWLNDFSGRLTDALISGKADFGDFSRTIIADLARIRIQSALADFFGAGSSGAGALAGFLGLFKADGGPVSGGRPYIVGERGPELFVPGASGAIVPNSALAGAGANVSVTLNVSTGVQQTVRAEVATLMPQITEAVKGAVAEARLRGGSFAAALGQ